MNELKESTAGETKALPESLRAIEARILGCLIEKQATTPEQYPLTANALTLACNQKTSREPVMDLELGEVGHAVRDLETRGLVKRNMASRADRIEHRFDQYFSVTSKQQALLALLMLRGPQTVKELLTRAERLAAFADAEDVLHTLERLACMEPALACNIGRAAGQREDRYMHRFFGEPEVSVNASHEPRGDAAMHSSKPNSEWLSRLEALEAEVQSLRLELTQLKDRLGE